MKVLILDNFDSFTYNLYQTVGDILEQAGGSFELVVKRNNAITVPVIKALSFDRIIISPGPGDPRDPAYFGVCAEVIRALGPTIPLLGVCLGMQGIAAVFGATIAPAPTPRHGKTSVITHDDQGLFRGLPQELEVMRYHSLIVPLESVPHELMVIAETNDEGKLLVMGLRHRTHPIEGVQFHPESFATEAGKKMLENFLGV